MKNPEYFVIVMPTWRWTSHQCLTINKCLTITQQLPIIHYMSNQNNEVLFKPVPVIQATMHIPPSGTTEQQIQLFWNFTKMVSIVIKHFASGFALHKRTSRYIPCHLSRRVTVKYCERSVGRDSFWASMLVSQCCSESFTVAYCFTL